MASILSRPQCVNEVTDHRKSIFCYVNHRHSGVIGTVLHTIFRLSQNIIIISESEWDLSPKPSFLAVRFNTTFWSTAAFFCACRSLKCTVEDKGDNGLTMDRH